MMWIKLEQMHLTCFTSKHLGIEKKLATFVNSTPKVGLDV